MFSKQTECGVLEEYYNLRSLNRKQKVHNNTEDPNMRSAKRILVCCVLGFLDQLSISCARPLKTLCIPIFPFRCTCALSKVVALR